MAQTNVVHGSIIHILRSFELELNYGKQQHLLGALAEQLWKQACFAC